MNSAQITSHAQLRRFPGILDRHLDSTGVLPGHRAIHRVGAGDDHQIGAGVLTRGANRLQLGKPFPARHQHLVALGLPDVDDVAAGPIRGILVFEVHAADPGADQFGCEGERLGWPAETGFHIHEHRWGREQFLALGVVVVRVTRAFDTLPQLVGKIGHLVRIVDADVGIHVLDGGELPARTVERLETEAGHDGRGIGVICTGGVHEGTLVACFVQQAAQFGTRLLLFRRREQQGQLVLGVGGVPAHGRGGTGHDILSVGVRRRAVLARAGTVGSVAGSGLE